MSFADLDGLCLQRVLRFVASALELARLDAVAKPQHGVTAVAESERRVRAMAIAAPAKQALRRGELRFTFCPGFPYSKGSTADEVQHGDDLETLLQRAVLWAGGWHSFLAARVGLLETRPNARNGGDDGVNLGDGPRATLPVHAPRTTDTEPLLLWELRRDGVTMHTELAPVGTGLRQSLDDEHAFLHVPWGSCLGDSCAAYAARTDVNGSAINENGPVHRKGGHDRFHISVPASDRAIWCARVSLLAPNTCNGGCCETLIHELEFDTGGFATSPQFRREDSRTMPEMPDDHMGGGSTHTGLNGPYAFTMLTHFYSPFFDFDESESEEAPPADAELLSPEFQVWAVVDYGYGTELNEIVTAAVGQPIFMWQSLRIHLNFRLLLDHRTLDAMISEGNRTPRISAGAGN